MNEPPAEPPPDAATQVSVDPMLPNEVLDEMLMDAVGSVGAAGTPLPLQSTDPGVLRLIDANANRAREALRVLEDYARFVLDDGLVSGGLKDVRHGLAAAVGPILPDAILYRDTPGDVGTATKTPAELVRANLADVVVAAGKRLGEALRSVEEYLKTIDPRAASRVELLRYATYELERRLTLSTGPSAARGFAAIRLYVLVTESVCRRPWLEAAEAAIRGGATCLQLREKGLESGELLRRAKQLVELCRDTGTLSIINDRPDIAVLAGANGVHVGQGDLPAADVRKIVGARRIVGVSTHEIDQAKQAVRDGADYLGVGPFFKSPTKPRDFTAGPAYARQVADQIRLPAVAIAGITADNVNEVLATGLRAVAVSSAVLAAADVEAAARGLAEKLGGPARVSLVGQTFLSANRRARASSPGPVEPPPGTFRLQITRRRLPHWTLGGATYFVTFRLAAGELSAAERRIVLDHLRAGHRKYYALVAAVVMPDHVHAIIEPNSEVDLARIMKGTKGASARLVNAARGMVGQVWQDESWDRIVRDPRELDEKLDYMLDNPVRKGLATDGWEWDGWHYNGYRG